MKKKNNNKTLLFTIFAVILTMVALIATSGTLARYTSSVETTEAEATVAKWKIKINNKDITKTTESVTFDLFDTIYDSDGLDEEENVSDGLIAPGTAGKFNFQIENLSDVDATYCIEMEETHKNTTVTTGKIPIEYSLDKTTYLSGEEFSEELKNNTDVIAKGGGTKTINVYWRWAFDVDDARNAKDTLLGVASQVTATTPSYEIIATIVATQVD